jgi:hypothetical protein
MHEERDEPNLMGQIAGMIAIMSAMVKSLPPSTRKKLLNQAHAEFESLLAAMSTTSGSGAQTERECVEWMRDHFLKQIAQANPKQKRRRGRAAAEEVAQDTALDTRSQSSNELPPSADVDIEL